MSNSWLEDWKEYIANQRALLNEMREMIEAEKAMQQEILEGIAETRALTHWLESQQRAGSSEDEEE